MKAIDKSKFNNNWYNPGSKTKILIWYICSGLFINSYLLPSSKCKIFILRLFGAKIGKRCTIKPNVNIKYPWLLEMGDFASIGENVWIDNLAKVKLGNNVTLSQGVYLLTGNHDYRSEGFDLIVKPITIKEGAWIGAKSIVCPGITCESHAILSVGSIATKNLNPYSIYQGNPAIFMKDRIIK